MGNDSSVVVDSAVSVFDFESFLIPCSRHNRPAALPLPPPPMGADEFDAAFLHKACSQWATIASFVIQEMVGGSIMELKLIKRWFN
jgi:hypothetical protein